MENENEHLLEKTLPQNITKDDLKNYMRIDFDDVENDMFIYTILQAAKSFVQTYLKWRFDDYPADEPFPQEITIAVLAISEHWYKNRGILNEDTSRQELPFVFSGILDIHRNWDIGIQEVGV